MSDKPAYKREKFNKKLGRLIVSLFVWIGAAIGYYIIFSLFFDTPIEHEVRQINNSLRNQYEVLKERYDSLELVMDNVVERDKNVYSILFESDPYAKKEYDESKYIDRIVSMKNSELADIFFRKMENVDNQLKRGKAEFDTLQLKVLLMENKVNQIPSLQPVTNKEFTKLATSYGMRIQPFFKTMVSHQGVDYAVPEDTRVYATADGVVKDVVSAYQSKGLSVIIDHKNGYETLYGHLNKSVVKKGQKINRGDIIAHSGNSGLSFMPHLHYEISFKGMRIDPINYFFYELSPKDYAKINEIAQIGMQSLD